MKTEKDLITLEESIFKQSDKVINYDMHKLRRYNTIPPSALSPKLQSFVPLYCMEDDVMSIELYKGILYELLVVRTNWMSLGAYGIDLSEDIKLCDTDIEFLERVKVVYMKTKEEELKYYMPSLDLLLKIIIPCSLFKSIISICMNIEHTKYINDQDGLLQCIHDLCVHNYLKKEDFDTKKESKYYLYCRGPNDEINDKFRTRLSHSMEPLISFPKLCKLMQTIFGFGGIRPNIFYKFDKEMGMILNIVDLNDGKDMYVSIIHFDWLLKQYLKSISNTKTITSKTKVIINDLDDVFKALYDTEEVDTTYSALRSKILDYNKIYK